ncbi:response regulator [Pectinatus sottacetonis]|uniref:response regulator n=1 Tax=Pectinatus sottacetonis TaxID=1002795 RepID=UPI0018C4B09D|nr:two-component system response regulator [Pectinatus sottacetonis]
MFFTKEEKPTILIVDDAPDNLTIAREILKNIYKIKVATNGIKALSIATASPPDLILLDVIMPQMDGYEVCKLLKHQSKTADIPIIFLTAKSSIEDEEKGLALGAVDYIIKPLSPPVLLSRIHNHLELKRTRDLLKNKNQYLEAEVARQVKEISLIQEVSIVAMAALAEARDNETGLHIHRTKEYVKELSLYLKHKGKFIDILTDKNINLIVKSAPLHDIGKVGIPDSILLKPGRLTTEEFEIMKTHTTIGKNAISLAESMLKRESENFLQFAKEIAFCHHEKWDGSGYPNGLIGKSIPLSARIMAVADVYDALISTRVYKKAFPHAMAVSIIKNDSGKHFDPVIIDAFIALEKNFQAISIQ